MNSIAHTFLVRNRNRNDCGYFRNDRFLRVFTYNGFGCQLADMPSKKWYITEFAPLQIVNAHMYVARLSLREKIYK